MKTIKQIGLLSFLLLFTIACKKDKTSAVQGEAAAVESATGGESYKLSSGLVNWTGSKLGGKHMGTIGIGDGKIMVKDGKVSGGKFIMNVSTLTVTDLKAGEGKEDLEGHLKAPDFFDVAAFPEATFEITKVTGLAGDADANSLVYGNLTLKDVTKEVAFKSKIDVTATGVSVSSPDFNINRTDFGMKYGSATFIDVVKDKAINDQVALSINLTASK